MAIIYLDESGNTGADLMNREQTIYVLCSSFLRHLMNTPTNRIRNAREYNRTNNCTYSNSLAKSLSKPVQMGM
ncbi:MAG: DUF3800 domain-containing protein, partial [Treponema sp.]|nr:DUF3800 domain-containing protein [Treponema sp.]